MKSIFNLNQIEYNFCENSCNCFKDSSPILLHAYMMKLLFHVIYSLKLHDVISTCFVLNMSGYGGHDIKANFTFMNSILGQFIKPMILNVMATHDEQNSEVYTSTEEDQQNPSSRNLQSTPKTIFKWSN